MSVLSAQSIRGLCVPNSYGDLVARTGRRDQFGSLEFCYLERPLIAPFSEGGTIRGRSYGLSSCTYDCRIAQDLRLAPGEAGLASTLEQFCIPGVICGSVLDKSTWARVFVSAFNTHLDPGWRPLQPGDTNHLTVELVNHGKEDAVYQAGDPVCQVKFEWLDAPTDKPYGGKYNSQPDRPVEAR